MLMLNGLIATAAVVLTAFVLLGRMADEQAYMRRYVFAPLIDISAAEAVADELHGMLGQRSADLATSARYPLLRLRAFIDRYRRDWETGASPMPEAARLREDLHRRGETRLLVQEHEMTGAIALAVTEMERTTGMTGQAPAEPPVRSGDVQTLTRALDALNALNLRYMEVAYEASERDHTRFTILFIGVTLAGFAAALLSGLAVRRSIAPRVARMVNAVERFRERGEPVPLADPGDDDLAVLAHTLDTSFKSIAERDQERERFLAVAAHELKTPLTTMKGFAQVALVHRDEPAVRERALSVIDRQSTRVARLVQDLLWSARAREGRLPFNPKPTDLEALVRRVIGDVEHIAEGHAFHLVSWGDPHILGDAGLLEHAVWNLLIQTAAMAPANAPVRAAVNGTTARVILTVESRCAQELPDSLDILIEPFATLQYENRREGPRSTGLGLHLVHEIVKVHGASLRIAREHQDTLVFRLELRR